MNMRLDPSHESRLHQLRELSKVYAKAKAEAVYLDHFRKSQLAILTSEYMSQGDSHNASESKARTRSEYLNVLLGLREAIEASEAAYWELRIAEAGIGLLRSKMANDRAEMSLT
jgi:hypothetical protein